MKTPCLVPLLITTLILASVSLVAVAYSEDDTAAFECFSREHLGLLVRIEVTALAWPGDNVNVTINATATQANVHIRYIHVNVSSLKENRSETLLSNTSFLEDVHLSLGGSNQTSYAIGISEDSVPGLLYGEVEYAWSIEGDENLEEEADTFPATYIQNKPYQDLLEDHEVLSDFSDALQKNYTDLEANYTDLQQEYQALADSQKTQSSATGLVYVLLITTGIFVVTTILLLAKHPKASTW
ncbi:MAG: hypothetical protein WCC63_02535 [Candidatus Bathyarchaeia archaeon]